MSAPPAIPDHTLLRVIGRGSYGEVWLARNVMGAPRAVKIVWRRQFDSDRPYEREFAGIQGYEPVSRLTDGLVQVLHVGRNEAEGYFYYVMELADDAEGGTVLSLQSSVFSAESSAGGQHAAGIAHHAPTEGGEDAPVPKAVDTQQSTYQPRTLRSDVRRLGRLPVADCLQIALDVVSGLARLHQHGLVHRDVKPGNIIFVNARAKLADIGLVSAGGEGSTFVGTEGYIPPEGPGMQRADIYALGMCLYEAVTGYSPEEFPKVPADWFSQTNDNQPLEFQEIVLKACEGSKERRYQSAEQLQADLAVLQSGQSVRRMRALEHRIARFRTLGLAALLVAVLALGAVLLANYRTRIEAKNRARELGLRQRAELAEQQSRKQLYAALLQEAHATVQSRELGQRVRALDAIRRAAAISNSTELRREAFAAFAQPDLRFERAWNAGPDATFVSLDPKFERVAVGRGKAAVEIRNLGVDQVITTLPPSTNLMAHVGTWSADGRSLAVKRDYDAAGEHADLEIWNVTNARHFVVSDVSWGSISFHPRGGQLLAGGTNASARVVDLEGGRELAQFPLPAAPMHLKFSPDGRRFAAVCSSGSEDTETVSVHEASNGRVLWANPRLWTNGLGMVNWHPLGRWLAIPDSCGAVTLFDPETGERHVLGEHKAQAVMVEFTPDGRYLLSGGWEGEIICWDLHTMQRAFTIGVDRYEMQIRADGQQCALRTQTSMQLYAIETPLQREFAEELGARLRQADFSPDGRWLAASGEKRGALWDLTHRAPGAAVEEAAGASFFFTPDGHELFTSSCGRWRITPAADCTAAPKLQALAFHKPEGSSSLSVASNFAVLTASQGSRVLRLQTVEGSAEQWVPTSGGINNVSPDGRWLAIFPAFGYSLKVYALPSLELRATLPHSAAIAGCEFSPSAEELAIYSPRAGVELWDTASWQRSRVLTNCSSIIFSGQGGGWWLIKDFRNAGLYDPQTLRELLPLPSGTLPLAVSADGRYLAVGVDGRRLQLWDLAEVRKGFRDLGVHWD